VNCLNECADKKPAGSRLLERSLYAAMDKRYVWHPFTQMSGWAHGPITLIERARGNYLYDTAGRKYLDAVSSLWVTVHGHNHPRINRAITAQLRRAAHTTFLGLSHPGAAALARRLVRLAPGTLARVFYSDNGSTAVEIALKMAYQYWRHRGVRGKNRFLMLDNAYHGDTIGAVSVGGIRLFHSIFKPLLFATVRAPSPYCYRSPYAARPSACGSACLRKTEQLMARHAKSLAACIVEPMVQAAGGMITMPPGYLKALERLCRRHGVLLIADEVATGFGRTGRMFACEHEGVQPDFLCCAKGLTGGYLPLAATLTTARVYRAFLGAPESCRTFFHGHTYTANPLACAAALANLDLFDEQQVLCRLQPKITLLAHELESLRTLPRVGEVRQCGMMVGIELVRLRRTRASYPAAARVGDAVCLAMRRRGIFLRPLGDVIVLMPPLSITPAEIRLLVRTLAVVLADRRIVP